MASLKMVEKKWLSYKKVVISDDAPIQQVEDEKTDFYAGAFTMLKMVMNISEKYSDEQGAKVLEDIHTECTQYLDTRAKRIIN